MSTTALTTDGRFPVRRKRPNRPSVVNALRSSWCPHFGAQFNSAKKYPEHLRCIRFKDPESGKTPIFLTNNTVLQALTIGALFKSRWQVELFFKWIKKHLRIKHFLGNSENAVKTQVWCAVATDVLIAIVKKELQLNASLHTCLQILSVSVFEKTEISCTLQTDQSQSNPPDDLHKLVLFNF